MCSQYWNLRADFTCPACGEANKGEQLQTHYMGEVGSCVNEYRIGEPVEELAQVSEDVLPRNGEDFIGNCDSCDAWIDFGAHIENGKVTEVWPYRYRVGSGPAIEVAA